MRAALDKIEWGPNDEIGAANNMPPDIVVKAAGLIKKLNLPQWTEVHRGRRRRRPEQARRRKNPADRHPWRVRDMAAHYKTDKPFHTGWTSLIGKDDRRYNAGEPVVGVEGAKYLVSKGVVAVGADTWAGKPSGSNPRTCSRSTRSSCQCPADQLALDKGYEFLFVLGLPKITGAVQHIINPVAIRQSMSTIQPHLFGPLWRGRRPAPGEG